jgi:serine phosphatase RsbU (regulator of sigma subunit)
LQSRDFKAPESGQRSATFRPALTILYSLLVGLVGLAALGYRIAIDWQGLEWGAILVFAVLSLLVQRSSFHFGSPTVHSLAGVIDLAAVLALGPTAGATVAALSGLAYLELNALHQRRLSRRDLLATPLFNAGLKASMALLAGALFEAIAGPLPLGSEGPVLAQNLDAQIIVAVLAVSALWFVLDHVGWGILDYLEGGMQRLRLFVKSALPQALLIELLPLPSSFVVALVYVYLSWPAFAVLAVAIVAIAVVTRHWADARNELEQLYAQERKRARQLETIGQVGRQVTAITELDELFERTVHLIRENFGYYHVAIYTADRDRETVTFQASASAGEQDVAFDVAWDQGLIGWVAARSQSVLINDVENEPRYRCIEALDETDAELAIPLLVEEEPVGVLDVQSDRVNAFGSDDLFILETLGDQIAIAIQEARLYEAERRQAWFSTALLQVADAMSQVSDMDAVLSTIVRLTPMLVGVDRCAVLLWDQNTETFVPEQTYGLRPELLETFEAMRFSAATYPALDLVRWDKRPLVVNTARDGLLVPRDLVETFDVQEMVVLPLLAQGEFLGAMMVDYAGRAHTFDERLIGMLSGIANQAAMVIQSARLVQAQQEEAYVSMALLQVAEAVSGSTDLDEILGTVARITPILVGVERCAIFVWDSTTSSFVPFQQYGLRMEDQADFWQLRFGQEAPFARELKGGEPFITKQDRAESLQIASVSGESTLLVLPLAAKGEVLGGMLVDNDESAQRFTQRRMNILTGIAGQAAIAVENDLLLQEAAEQERMKQELDVARRIQTSFLPESCPGVPGWELATVWRSAREVGGDFYDCFPLPAEVGGSGAQGTRTGIVIADVADKGVPSALFMALCRTLVRTAAMDGRSPDLAINRANDLILADARSDLFVTLFYAILRPNSGNVAYVNAGHMPPLLVRSADGAVEELRTHGMALGVLSDIQLEGQTVQLAPDDILVMYTDGVIEAQDRAQQMYGKGRLIETIRSHQAESAGELAQTIDDAVAGFVGDAPQFDDFTLLVAKRSSA